VRPLPHRGMSFRLLLLALALAAPAAAAPLADAVALLKARKYPEARQALEAILAVEPQNARANFFLAQVVIVQGHSAQALTDALVPMEKAAKAAPADPEILAAYGQLSLQVAAIHFSVPAGLRGRDALESALKLNPHDLAARETLYQFYRQAPWPLSSKSKAAEQLEGIRRLNPDRASMLDLNAQVAAKDYAGAFQTCDRLLAKNSDHHLALFNYGRIADISGQNLARGLTCLKRYLELAPTEPEAPRAWNAWGRLGNIQVKLGDSSAARAAYEKVLQLQPGNKGAAAALAQLK
jgi:tetratricopeptide (TPR) repeat protein